MKIIDKNLIKSRFEKALTSYNDNAKIQKLMAIKTFELIKEFAPTKELSVFEVGCGTGFLTKFIDRNVKLSNYMANDIVAGSKSFIENINPNIKFVSGDIEELNLEEKFDVIVSNAVFQWVEEKEELFEKLASNLKPGGLLVFSAFGKENFREIRSIRDMGLVYEDYKRYYQNYFSTEFYNQSINEMYFESAIDVLKHIKNTGTNAINVETWTKSDFKCFEQEYKSFQKETGLTLTYNPVYYVLKKK